jgi:hypothetical protein
MKTVSSGNTGQRLEPPEMLLPGEPVNQPMALQKLANFGGHFCLSHTFSHGWLLHPRRSARRASARRPNLLPPEIPIRPAMIIVHAHIFDDVPVL